MNTKDNNIIPDNQLFDENFFFKECGFADEEEMNEYLAKVNEEFHKWQIFES